MQGGTLALGSEARAASLRTELIGIRALLVSRPAVYAPSYPSSLLGINHCILLTRHKIRLKREQKKEISNVISKATVTLVTASVA